MRNGKFEEVWPKGENFWLNKSLEFEGNNIKIYELEYGLHTEAKLIYLYSLAWDSGSCALTER